MPRGGYRENAGRKTNWLSSNVTKPIRVPEPLVDQLLDIARRLDSGEVIEKEQNQNISGDDSLKLDRIKEIIVSWELEVQKAKEGSVRFKNVVKIINEIKEAIE
jgi:hypothetical protein